MQIHPTRRRAISFAAALLAFGAARAQGYPERPVRIVSFVPTSSSADALLRAMAVEVGPTAGAEFVVDNRPGGSGAVAASAVRGSAADGYTLLLGGSSVMLSGMQRGDGDPFAGLVPVAQVMTTPTALGMRADLGVRNVADLVRLARERPGQVSYATAGTGSYAHYMMELLARRAGVQLLHVPYPQLGNAITDTLGGRVDGVFTTFSSMLPHAAAGKMTLVGMTGEKRTAVAPDVATFAESGFAELGASAWLGLFAPAGTPQAVLDKVAAEFLRSAQAGRVREVARSAALEIQVSTPRAFAELLARERGYWKGVIAETGVRAQ